jgi:hypothetical protein
VRSVKAGVTGSYEYQLLKGELLAKCSIYWPAARDRLPAFRPCPSPLLRAGRGAVRVLDPKPERIAARTPASLWPAQRCARRLSSSSSSPRRPAGWRHPTRCAAVPGCRLPASARASRSAIIWDTARATFCPVSERSAGSNRHSRVNWSTTVSTRNQRPSTSRSLTKSIAQRWLGRVALSGWPPLPSRDLSAHLGAHRQSIFSVQPIDAFGVHCPAFSSQHTALWPGTNFRASVAANVPN